MLLDLGQASWDSRLRAEAAGTPALTPLQLGLRAPQASQCGHVCVDVHIGCYNLFACVWDAAVLWCWVRGTDVCACEPAVNAKIEIYASNTMERR